jgi:vacuolar-type H+-ATPase subunit H
MKAVEPVKILAELEAELAKKLDEARRCAEQRIASAEQEAQRILTVADAQIRQMADTSKARIAEESEKYAEEARGRAEAEAQRIREQAERNIDRAVDYIFSEVLP